jgi:hypothetical protein
MIIKNADSKDAAIATLESLLATADSKTQKAITDELRFMRAGIRGEEESAYHINFSLKNSNATAVIHDLRLSYGGRVAQIDHLLVHRTHRFYVLETKSFSHGLKINEQGEFLRWNDWKKCYEGVPSPIEQNKRHVAVLREVLERFGYKDPAIESFVLISPKARIDRPKNLALPELVKADQFLSALEKDLSNAIGSVGGFFGAISKMAFAESFEEVAKKLARLHRPITFDYAGKFGIRDEQKRSPAASHPQASVCQSVGIEFGNTQVAPTRPTSAPAESRASTAEPKCKACDGNDLAIEYGRYGYYFKCGSCGGNTSLKIGCGVPGHKERIRKDKLNFYRECDECKTSSIFFEDKD